MCWDSRQDAIPGGEPVEKLDGSPMTSTAGVTRNFERVVENKIRQNRSVLGEATGTASLEQVHLQ